MRVKEVVMKRFKVIIASFVWCIIFGSMTGLAADIEELRSAIKTGVTEEPKMQNKNFLKSIFKKRTVPIKKMHKKDSVQEFRNKKREDFLQKWNDFLYETNKQSLIAQTYSSQKSLMPFMDFYIKSLGEKEQEQGIQENRTVLDAMYLFFTQILYGSSYIYSIDSFMALTDKEKGYVHFTFEAALNALIRYLGESNSLVKGVESYLNVLQVFSDGINQEKINSFKRSQGALVTLVSDRLKSQEISEFILEKGFLNILFSYCMFMHKNMVPHLEKIVLQKDNSDSLLLQILKENALISEQKETESVSAEDFLDMVLVAPEYIALIKNIQLCLNALSKGAIIVAQNAIDKKVVIGGVQELSLDQMIDVLQGDPTAPAAYLGLIKKLVTTLMSKRLEWLTLKDLQKMQRLIARKIEEDPLRPEWKSFADKRKLFLYSYVAFLNANVLPLIQNNLKKRETTPSLYQRFLQFWKNKKKDFEG